LLNKIIDTFNVLSSDKICTEGINPRNDLETKIVDNTRQFYRQKATEMIQKSTLVGYLQISEKMLDQEKQRFSMYLQWDSVQ